MKKLVLLFVVIFTISSIMFSCNSNKKDDSKAKVENKEKKDNKDLEKKPEKKIEKINYQEVKPNEAGEVMVVMFHNFVETFEPKKWDKGEYTTTFTEFEKLLGELYEKKYRLVNMNDFMSNNIDVPAGCTPMIFTFDDGTKGQFSLVEKDGKLVAEEKSAVGIMEKFNKEHPDFGMKGTFYVNLGNPTFEGSGTLAERLKYLVDKGYEIGNHTYTHINLKQTSDSAKIQEELGNNYKAMLDLVPDYKMKTFSLPYGAPSNDALFQYVIKGDYNGTKYENTAIMEVGYNPNPSPVASNFEPYSINRIRSSGINPVDCDLAWWLAQSSTIKKQYVSDGNPDEIAVPADKESSVNKENLQGKKLVVY